MNELKVAVDELGIIFSVLLDDFNTTPIEFTEES